MSNVEMIEPKPYSILSFIKNKVNGGMLLLIVAILAMIVANSPLKEIYKNLWDLPVYLQIGDFNIFSHGGKPMTFSLFINDVLMVYFFLLVGLEIKREVLVGELSSLRKALLPIIAACGGMIIPTAIFAGTIMLNPSISPDALKGMAVPMATDIAFSLGVLSLLGSRVPISLKIFLTTLAVADDIGGIIVIALFYSTNINLVLLGIAFGLLALLYFFGQRSMYNGFIWVFVGVTIVWLFIHSGVHATIAGVLIAFTLPARPAMSANRYVSRIFGHSKSFPELEAVSPKAYILTDTQLAALKSVKSASSKVISPLQKLEDQLHMPVNFIIMPLFAFANAGVELGDMGVSDLGGVALAAFLGLFVGKLLGVFSFTWLAVKAKICDLPSGTDWHGVLGAAMLAGIGFTVSLFIANLSYLSPGDPAHHHPELLNQVKLGVIAATVVSGTLGYLYLNHLLKKK